MRLNIHTTKALQWPHLLQEPEFKAENKLIAVLSRALYSMVQLISLKLLRTPSLESLIQPIQIPSSSQDKGEQLPQVMAALSITIDTPATL